MARSVPRSALRSCAHREAAGRCNSPATAAPGSGAASPSTGHPDSSRRPARRRSRGYDRSSPYMGCSKLRQGRSITENPTATTYIGFLEQQGYARTFPDSTVGAVHRAPSDFPGGKAGDVLTVEFTVCGVPCLGLNGGDMFKHSEAFSFQIATDDQVETDRYWNAIVGNGGAESACGWCKDKWGLSWQITRSEEHKSELQSHVKL